MFYAVFLPLTYITPEDEMLQLEDLIFTDIKDASAALKKYKGSRMRTFEDKDKALECMLNPEKLDESLSSTTVDDDISASFGKMSILDQERRPSPLKQQTDKVEETPSEFPTAKPDMLNKLRRKIEAGDYEEVEQLIWSNPRCLVTVCDSAVYLMAGPKYNACHIAARANKPDIMALLLDTISNFSFLKKLYPNEPDVNVQDRINHLLDSYLNTADPRQGNTPLHFACKLGHYRVVRVLLTFEGCDLSLKDSQGRTAEECICLAQNGGGGGGGEGGGGSSSSRGGDDGSDRKGAGDEGSMTRKKMKDLFKCQLHSPLHRDQLKKRLLLAKRRNKAAATGGYDSDISFSDMDDSLSSMLASTSLVDDETGSWSPVGTPARRRNNKEEEEE